MDALLGVETESFVACSEEDAVREQRRIEFRKSLDQARKQARALLMRPDGRARAQECEPRGMQMELVPAR